MGVAPGPGEGRAPTPGLGVNPDPPPLSPCDKSSLGNVSKEVFPRGGWWGAITPGAGGAGDPRPGKTARRGALFPIVSLQTLAVVCWLPLVGSPLQLPSLSACLGVPLAPVPRNSPPLAEEESSAEKGTLNKRGTSSAPCMVPTPTCRAGGLRLVASPALGPGLTAKGQEPGLTQVSGTRGLSLPNSCPGTNEVATPRRAS